MPLLLPRRCATSSMVASNSRHRLHLPPARAPRHLPTMHKLLSPSSILRVLLHQTLRTLFLVSHGAHCPLHAVSCARLRRDVSSPRALCAAALQCGVTDRISSAKSWRSRLPLAALAAAVCSAARTTGTMTMATTAMRGARHRIVPHKRPMLDLRPVGPTPVRLAPAAMHPLVTAAAHHQLKWKLMVITTQR